MAQRPAEKFNRMFDGPSRPDVIPEPEDAAEFRRLAVAVRDQRFGDAARHTRNLRRMGWSVMRLNGGAR